jgi:hypothetical protein
VSSASVVSNDFVLSTTFCVPSDYSALWLCCNYTLGTSDFVMPYGFVIICFFVKPSDFMVSSQFVMHSGFVVYTVQLLVRSDYPTPCA